MKIVFPALLSAAVSMSFPGERAYYVSVKKPSPCYEVRSFTFQKGILRVYLERKSADMLCPQVITEEKLRLDPDKGRKVRLIRVYVGERLWGEFSQ